MGVIHGEEFQKCNYHLSLPKPKVKKISRSRGAISPSFHLWVYQKSREMKHLFSSYVALDQITAQNIVIPNIHKFFPP